MSPFCVRLQTGGSLRPSSSGLFLMLSSSAAPHLYLLLVLLLAHYPHPASPATTTTGSGPPSTPPGGQGQGAPRVLVGITRPNLCSTAGLCCKHRDSECVVQKEVSANESVDTSALPCYCDHACLHLDDCCEDYEEFCAVRDCGVSEWGPWSPCPPELEEELEDCSEPPLALTERHRVILHQPLNGGRSCPPLAQTKYCPRSARCRKEEEAKAELQRKTASKSQQDIDHVTATTPSSSSSSFTSQITKKRLHKLVPHQETPPLSFRNSSTSSTTSSSSSSSSSLSLSGTSCVQMVVLRNTIGCRRQERTLHKGARVCIQCQLRFASTASTTTSAKRTRRRRWPEENKASVGNEAGAEAEATSSLASCDQLLQPPTHNSFGEDQRRFRLDRHCHGMLGLTNEDAGAGAGAGCHCQAGLKFKLVR